MKKFNYINNNETLRFASTLEWFGAHLQMKMVKYFIEGEPFMNGERMLIDFNNVVKMPEELRNIYFGSRIMNISEQEVFCDNLESEQNLDENNSAKNHGNTCQRYYDVTSQRKEFLGDINSEKLGECEKWCIENWGMKDNPTCQFLVKDNMITFHTDNGSGLRVIKRLSEIFPEITFRYHLGIEIDEEITFVYSEGMLEEVYYNEKIQFHSKFIQRDEILYNEASKYSRLIEWYMKIINEEVDAN